VYANFDKSFIAGFAKEIAIGCEKGDPLCLKIFEEAGQLLAKHINAVSKKAHNVSIFKKQNDLNNKNIILDCTCENTINN